MNDWHIAIINADKFNRQELIKLCHNAGNWHSCPTALLKVKRYTLGEPKDERLYKLDYLFHQYLINLLALWPEKFFARKKSAAVKFKNGTDCCIKIVEMN